LRSHFADRGKRRAFILHGYDAKIQIPTEACGRISTDHLVLLAVKLGGKWEEGGLNLAIRFLPFLNDL